MSPSVSRRRAFSRWTWFLLGMACLLLPSLAMAQSGPYSVSDDDLSKKIFLDYLFGPLTGSGTSPLTSVVLILNSAILFLGGIFMAYTIIAGTMSTAHDGEMLGKKWSSLWLPIRTTLGAAAVMPVIGGGWCAAQALVVWLATLGIGIANAMWGAYINNGTMLNDAMYNPPSMSHQVFQTYENMLISNVCVVAYQKDNDQVLSQAPAGAAALNIKSGDYNAYPYTFSVMPNSSSPIYATTPVEMSGIWYGTQLQVAAARAGLGPSPSCGSIIFPHAAATAAAPSGGAGGASGNGGGDWSSVTGQTLLNMPEVNSKILPTQLSAISSAQGALYALATKIVTTGGDPTTDAALSQEVNSTLNRLVQNYSTTVGNQAKSVYASAINPNYLTTMSKDGWVTAGAFYMEIARAQDQLTDAVTTLPTTTNSWSTILQTAAEDKANGKESSWWTRMWTSLTPDSVIDSMGRALKFASIADAHSSGGVASITNANNASSSQDSLSGSWTDRFVSAFTSSRTDDGWFSGNNNDAGTGLNQNPIISAKNLGNQMINWAWASLGVMAGIGAFTLGGAGVGTFTIIAGPFTMLFGTLIVAGSTMAFYLPMLPYILWIGVVLGWAVLLIEAVIAAPLWAVVHMAPDGDGVVGRGGQGYMLILSLTLRPALMIMGLVAAISLMRPLGYLINSTFGGAFAISHGPGVGGLTAMIAGVAIYTGVMVSVVNRVFALIHVVPDRLLRWIGGGGNELGSEAQALDQGSAGKMIAATGAASQLSQQAQGMLSGARQHRQGQIQAQEAREGKLAQERGNIGDSVSRADKSAGQSMDAADRGNSMDGPGEKTANKYAHARSEAQSARAEAITGAETMAKNIVAAGSPDAPSSQEFLSELGEARAAQAGGDREAMDKFVEAQSAKSSAALNSGARQTEPQKLMDKALKNQERMKHAEEGMTFASSIDEARQAGGSGQAGGSDPEEGRGV